MPGSETRVIYTDLDGTMVGPRGNFFSNSSSKPTLDPARALVALHEKRIPLVLVSGRTRAQLTEAGRIFGADGFVGELGGVLGWNGGFRTEVLAGAMPAEFTGQTPMEVMLKHGIIDQLFSRWPGLLEWHEPWHLGHEADAMLRGLVDPAEAHDWLETHGWGWLRLHDNGVLDRHRPTGLDPAAIPAHVYHLMPDGLSKGLGIEADLARRGLTGSDAIAIGDSISDLGMAPYVRELWLVGNGPRNSTLTKAAVAVPNIRFAQGDLGAGWADAVRSALPTSP
jgi:hydroxymethylpyrimidine pyrophosphatase-like HAD family hydrolase